MAKANKEDFGETTMKTMTKMLRKNLSPLTNGSQRKFDSIQMVNLSVFIIDVDLNKKMETNFAIWWQNM